MDRLLGNIREIYKIYEADIQIVSETPYDLTLDIRGSRYIYRGLSPFLIGKFKYMLSKGANFNAINWLKKQVPENKVVKMVFKDDQYVEEATNLVNK
jgi:hypothetical protein